MASSENRVAVRRDHEVFVVAETTKGTLVAPAAGNYIIPVGLATMVQDPSFSDSEEIQNTRDTMDRFQDRMGAGDWSIPIYIRPSGTAGTAPMEAALLLALFGTETIVGSTSVTYTQAINKPSVSIWMRTDHTAFFATGATVSSAKLSAAAKGAFKLEISGKFMQMGIVGTQDLAVAITATDTTFEVDDASCYSVGGLVEFYDVSAGTVDDNTTGYVITDVNTTTNVITTSAIGSSFDIDDICRPFLPAGTEVGAPVENRKTTVSIDSVAKNVKKFDLSIDDPCVYMEDEITTGDYPEDYVEDKRKIGGSIGLLFRKNDAKYFIDNVVGSNVPLEMVVGDTAGSIVTIAMPNCSLNRPKPGDNAPTLQLDMPFTALGNSTGEDSLSIAFT